MELNDYQKEAMKFAKYSDVEYPFLALTEEVGEVMGKLAKFVRKESVSVSDAIIYANSSFDKETKGLKAGLKKELGDVLWQLQACCNELGLSLEDVAKSNLDKLSGRDERGTIVGEGDER